MSVKKNSVYNSHITISTIWLQLKKAKGKRFIFHHAETPCACHTHLHWQAISQEQFNMHMLYHYVFLFGSIIAEILQ